MSPELHRHQGLPAGERQLDRLVADGLRRQHDRSAGVGHRRRADRGVRCGQSRVAQPYGHLLRCKAERVGRDLLHHGVGAGAELVHPGFDERRTVALERNPRLGRPAPMRVDRSRHPLADQVAAVAHRARLGRPLVPAETRTAFRQAFAHRARGEWTAAERVGFGVVEQAQRDRIDAGRVGQFIHRALEREMAERLVRRAHRGRRVAVYMHDLVVRRDSRRRPPTNVETPLPRIRCSCRKRVSARCFRGECR